MVGNHIILAAHSAGLLNVLILGERNSASAILLSHCQLVISLPLSVFLWIFGVVDDVADGLPPPGGLCRCGEASGAWLPWVFTSLNQNGLPKQTALFFIYRIDSG